MKSETWIAYNLFFTREKESIATMHKRIFAEALAVCLLLKF